MKASLALAAAALAPGVLSRSIHKKVGAYDMLNQKTHVSAIVINKQGQLNLECWEVDTEFQSLGSHGAMQTLAHGSEVDGVSIVTYGPQSRIWPPHREDVHASFSLLGEAVSLYVQAGTAMVNWITNAEEGQDSFAIFNTDRGNNMLYLEDQRSSSSNYTEILAQEIEDDESPMVINTIGNSPLQMFMMRTPSLKKRKLHNGVCNHAGVNLPDEEMSRGTGHIDVNLRIQEL